MDGAAGSKAASDGVTPASLIRRRRPARLGPGPAEEARQVVEGGTAWLRDVAARHVPPDFRESFLDRNPVNLELHRLAIRLG